ncbi:NADH pyrophosphatase zinc ribbon domain-containing protein [Paucilactobacillus hokkaidonensis]|uniref:NADH pyrophosphatase zinc ribbon domain-containing protein n=1 Tax=Paucilactobacillus hokkaidonensis TaxID=1193095 RepID=UPI000AF08AB7|nr:NADH pyrophosphatase zinc ribbon domain-containing protein [Paucilactobacillus hokkaidonensis]
MFQDIQPHILDIQYKAKTIQNSDLIVIIRNGLILMLSDQNELRIPTLADLSKHYKIKLDQANYLLSIEGKGFYAFDLELPEKGGFAYADMRVLRTLAPRWLAFAMATAVHLANWYLQNRYCGHCAHLMEKGTDERKLVCPNCRMDVFPKISPVIIVGVRKQNQLLLTKYAEGYDHYASLQDLLKLVRHWKMQLKERFLRRRGWKLKIFTIIEVNRGHFPNLF